MLVARIAGWPLISTRVAGAIHCTRMHGIGGVEAESGQPAMRYWSAMVATGMPETSTRVLLEIVVTCPADGRVVAKTPSNDQGEFSFSGVAPGTYAAVGHKPSFKTATAIVTVTSNGAKPVMLAMASEEALSLAVVAKRLEAARNGLSPETGSSVYRFSEKAIHDLPQGANSQMNEVLLQAPGVVQDSFGALHIRGEHSEIQYRINGIELPEGIATGSMSRLNNIRQCEKELDAIDAEIDSGVTSTIAQVTEEEARQLLSNYISTEHLVLGMLREGDGLAAKVLAQLGADLEQMRAAVQTMQAS